VIKYLLRQLLAWFIRIFLAINITYFVANIFLDPSANYVERRPPISPERIQQMLEPYNLSHNEPLLHRWWDWLTGVVTRWDWGLSPIGGSVNEQIAFRVGVSAQLMLGATIIAFIIGVALGVYSASRQYKLGDRVVQVASIIGLNTSIVVVALVVVFIAIQANRSLGWTLFFVTGSGSIGVEGFGPMLVDKLQHLVLPSICLIFISWASYTMLQRSLLLDNISADYVRTARAKGLPQAVAIRRHALRTSMIPVMVSFAFSIPGIFTGAMLSENIFAWNGMGRYMVTTIYGNDIHGAVAVAAFSSLMVAIGAVLSDLAVVWLDPRVRVN
jgi:peptide/nickel transport system permease protein